MKRLITNDTKQNKKQKISKECKIIAVIANIKYSISLIQTPCGKFLIGVEGNSIFCYNLETKQKFRIAGSIKQWGHQDGTRNESRFFLPQSLTLSKDLKTLFVTDAWNHVIRAICVGTGITITFAGQVDHCESIDGPKKKACFRTLETLKLSPDGNTLIAADRYKVRTACIATGKVDTICTFEYIIQDLTFSPDSKHIYICNRYYFFKYNLKTDESDFILEGKGFYGCVISKDGQLLFVSNHIGKYIQVVNLDTNEVIDTITTEFHPTKLVISTNGKQLYIVNKFKKFNNKSKINVRDISKHCTNFKTFLQLQLSKHSFLSRSLVKRIN